METNSCLNCGKDDNRTGKPCPDRKDCFFPDYKEWELIAEKPETGRTDFSSRLVMEDWEISWGDENHISIAGPNNQTCMVVPGDFESILSGLCGVYHSY